MEMVEIVRADADMAKRFGATLARTGRVIAVVRGERVLAMGGYYPDEGRMMIWSRLTDEVSRHPRALLKAARILVGELRAKGMPVHAVRDPSIDTSERFLRHLGFAPAHKDVWVL